MKKNYKFLTIVALVNVLLHIFFQSNNIVWASEFSGNPPIITEQLSDIMTDEYLKINKSLIPESFDNITEDTKTSLSSQESELLKRGESINSNDNIKQYSSIETTLEVENNNRMNTENIYVPSVASQNTSIAGTWGEVAWEFNPGTKELIFTGTGNLGTVDTAPWKNGVENIDDIGSIIFNNKVFAPEDSSYLFSGLHYLYNLDITKIDTSKVTNMSYMFSETAINDTLNFSNFNTSNVSDMSYMFSGMTNLKNLDLSSFDTSKVKNMSGMFLNTNQLNSLVLSEFNTSNVINMSYMFSNMFNLTSLDLSNFDTSNVINMEGMFSGDLSLSELNINDFNTVNVLNMSFMFSGLSNITNLNISSFDTRSVTTMAYMFHRMEQLYTLNLNNFITDSVIDMTSMFEGCMSITELDLSNFNTSQVAHLDSMFYFMAYIKKLDISNFTSTEVTTMNDMFTSNFFLEEIVMSPYFKMNISAGLEDLVEDDVYTGKWQNISNGSHEFPTGNNIWTSLEFMDQYEGSRDADTYIWQKRRTKAANLNVDYQDTLGNKISESKIVSGNIGDGYNVSTNEYKMDIDGYTFKEVKGAPTEGSLSYSEQSVIYIYTKNITKAANLNVDYQDTLGNKISESKIVSGNIGDGYDVSTDEYKMKIDGYTFKEVKGDPTAGTLSAEEKSVTYVYTKNIIKAANLNVDYQDTFGNTISESKIVSGNIGDEYDVSTDEYKMKIDGYTFKEIKGVPTKGILSAEEKSIIFIYEKTSLVISEEIADKKINPLPKTGQSSNYTFIVVGIIIITLIATTLFFRFKKFRK